MRLRSGISSIPTTVKVLLGLLGVLALIVTLSYRPETLPAEVEARYADQDSRFIDVHGLRVHYKDQGSGSPVVLLHGTGSSLHTWDGWTEELSGDFRILRLDLPGFGLTGPDPLGDYSANRRSEIVSGLLDNLGVRRSTVVGNSLGGLVALRLAIAHPTRVDRLVLIAPAGHPAQQRGGATVLDLGRLPFLNRLLTRLTPRFLVARAVREAYFDPTRVTPDLIDRHHDLLLRQGNRAALLEGLTTEGTLDRDVLRSVRQPVLLMWGAADRLIAFEMAGTFHNDLRNSTLITYDDLGHVPMEEDPRRTASDTRRFLEGQ